MKRSTALFLAFRSYKPGDHKKKSSRPLLGAILGIALSLIPLIVVIHISDGMIEGITGRYVETLTYHLQIFSNASPSDQDYQTLSQDIESLQGVTHSVVERQGYGMIYSEYTHTGITLRAVEEELYLEDEEFIKYMEVIEGSFDLRPDRAVVIGEEVANKLQVHVGDDVKVLTGKIFPNGKYVPRITPFQVTGIVSSGYQELDRLWVFIPLDKGLRMMSDDSSETLIGIKTDDPYGDLYGVISQIGGIADSKHSWRAYTWQNLNSTQQKSFQTTKMLLQIIMALLVVVAVMNVASSMIMLVMENSFEIGILKCIGADPGGIRMIYRFIGLTAGVLGTLLGLVLGIVISASLNEIISGTEWLVNHFLGLIQGIFTGEMDPGSFQLLNSAYYLHDIPITIHWGTLGIVALVTILLSWLASAFPAAKAGRIRPLQVIRKH